MSTPPPRYSISSHRERRRPAEKQESFILGQRCAGDSILQVLMGDLLITFWVRLMDNYQSVSECPLDSRILNRSVLKQRLSTNSTVLIVSLRSRNLIKNIIMQHFVYAMLTLNLVVLFSYPLGI